MRRRDCANDEYWFNGGSEWVIDDIMTGGFEKTLKWDPSIRKYKSSLPGEDAFWYEIVGACSRGEPKAWASCKSVSWKNDQYCAAYNSFTCNMLNVYQKRDSSSGPISIWAFKHSGQCSIDTYNYTDWSEQYDPVCPGIHQKSFKYVDSCEWQWPKKEVVCQSRSSGAVLNDSNCSGTQKPSYSTLCWDKGASLSTPPSTPTPPTEENIRWKFGASFWGIGDFNPPGDCSSRSRSLSNSWYCNDGKFEWESLDNISYHSHRRIRRDNIKLNTANKDVDVIWIEGENVYLDKEKTKKAAQGIYKLSRRSLSGDTPPNLYLYVRNGKIETWLWTYKGF